VLSCAHNPWHDVVELGQILDALENQGQQLEPEVCGRLLSLYRGSYLPEHYADWAVSFRERLDSRISAFLTRALQEGGKLTPAVRAEIAHRLLEIDPCHQPACGELMNQAVQQGRPEEATRLFKRLETRLRSELGVEPDIKLVELFYRAELGLSHSV
jgi:DNA-binding SARP family transcriptional activator